jgi:hypothetical protein
VKKYFQITKSNAIVFIPIPFFENLKINEHSMFEDFMNIDPELITSLFIKNEFRLKKHITNFYFREIK